MSDKEKCAVWVRSENGWGTHRCSRNATKGDYCYQHDPAAVTARENASALEWQRKQDDRLRPRRELRRHKEVLGHIKVLVDHALAEGRQVRPVALQKILEVLDD